MPIVLGLGTNSEWNDPFNFYGGEAPGLFPKTDTSSSLPAGMSQRDWDDTVNTVIAEAAGEGDDGMAGVAHVIRNRSNIRGKSIGDVVREPDQFTGYSAPGAKTVEAMRDPAMRARAEGILRNVLTSDGPDPTDGADHYHTKAVSPSWAASMPQTTTIGEHIYYNSKGEKKVTAPDATAFVAEKDELGLYGPKGQFRDVLQGDEGKGEKSNVPNPNGKGLARLVREPEDAPLGTGGKLNFVHAGQDKINPQFASILSETSKAMGRDFTINSGYRSPSHRVEAAKPGGPGEHSTGDASDITMKGMSEAERGQLVRELYSRGARRFITYTSSPDMLHVDMKDQTGKGTPWFMHDKSNRNLGKAPAWFQEVAANPGQAVKPQQLEAIDTFGLYADRAKAMQGDLRPFQEKEERPNSDGSVSTEISTTWKLPDGKWVNVPSLWMGKSGPKQFAADDEDAILGTMRDYEAKNGPTFQRFDSEDAAVAAAKNRSAAGGAASSDAAQRAFEESEAKSPGKRVLVTEDEAAELQKKWEKENRSSGVAGDIGRMLGAANAGLGLATREAVGMIPKVGPSIVKGLDAIDEWVTGKPVTQRLEEYADRANASVTERQQVGDAKEWWDKEKGTFGPAWSDPRSYLGGVVRSLPATIVTMAPGGILARGAYLRALAAGATEKVAAAAMARTATIAGGLSEGLVAGGESSISVKKRIDQIPREQLAQSDAVKVLVDGGMSVDEAITAVREDAATQAFLVSGVTTGIFGGNSDRILANMIAERVSGGFVRRLLAGATRGAAGEALLEELPQNVAQTVSENAAVRRVNPDQDVLEGIEEAAASGIAVGGAMGGGMGGVAGVARPAHNTAAVADDGATEFDAVQPEPDKRGPLRRAADHGQQRETERATAANSGAPIDGRPAAKSTVRVEAEGIEPFMGTVEGYEGGEAIIFDSGSGEVFQVPIANIKEIAPPVGDYRSPEKADDSMPELSADPALEPLAPMGSETTTEMPPRSEDMAATDKRPTRPQPGHRVIVDSPEVGRFPARIERYENEGNEALVVDDKGNPYQVPTTALKVSSLTPAEIEAQDLERNPPIEREIGDAGPNSRKIGEATVILPDDNHAALYDFANQRLFEMRTHGRSRIGNDGERLQFGSRAAQRELADKFGISFDDVGAVADDYRFRVERATKQAKSTLPFKMNALNDRLLKQRQAARAKEANEPLVQPADDGATWWDVDSTAQDRKRVLEQAGVKRSERMMWQGMTPGIKKKLLDVRDAQRAAVDDVATLAGEDEVSAKMRAIADEIGQDDGAVYPDHAEAMQADAAAHMAATSPTNDLPEPTAAQKEAGNYRLGHIRLGGMDISIENPAGSQRKGVSQSGKAWSVTMKSHYGYIRSVNTTRSNKSSPEATVAGANVARDAAQALPVSDQSIDLSKVNGKLVAAVTGLDTSPSKDLSKAGTVDTENGGNALATDAIRKELYSFFDVPLEDPDIRVEALITEAVRNSTAADTHLFGDATYGHAIRAQGFDSLDVERQSMVKARMLTRIKNREVAENIVDLVPVPVMDMLRTQEGTTDSVLNDHAVLLDSLSGTPPFDDAIAVGRLIDAVATTLPVAFALRIAEKMAALGYPPTRTLQQRAAGITGNSLHSNNEPKRISPKGADKDHIDIFVKPGTKTLDNSSPIFVVDQKDPARGRFDEHKILAGFDNEAQARAAYLENYTKDWKGLGDISKTTLGDFKTWLKSGKTTEPFAPKSFASQDKADGYIATNKMGKTHEVVQRGKRFEILERSRATPRVQSAKGTDIDPSAHPWTDVWGSDADAISDALGRIAAVNGGDTPISDAIKAKVSNKELLELIQQRWGEGGAGGNRYMIETRKGPVVTVTLEKDDGNQSVVLRGKDLAEAIRKEFAVSLEDMRQASEARQVVRTASTREGLNYVREAGAAAVTVDESAKEQVPHQSRETVTDREGRKYKARGEKLPQKGLAPANIGADGVVYIGEVGSQHFVIADKHQDAAPFDNLGFVTPDGDFLDRKQALEWVNTNEKPVRAGSNMAGELDALDYKEQVPAAVKAGKGGNPAVKAKPEVSANKLFTDDAAAKARELLRKKLSGNTLNSGIDPELLQAGITLAGYHIEKGARTFAAYASAMLADLGEGARPYLKSWYMGVRYDPRAADFDGMSSAVEVDAADVNTFTGATNEPEQLDRSGAQALEGVPAEPLQGAENGRDTGRRVEDGSGTDVSGDRPARAERVPAGRSVADGQGELSPAAAGRQPAGRNGQPNFAGSDERGAQRPENRRDQVEEGPFGPILRGFEGKWRDAALELERRQTGDAIGALSHSDVGPIDLVWGRAGNNQHDGSGLAKLIAWHPEVLEDLQGFIDGLHVDPASRTERRIQLVSDNGRAGIRLDYDGNAKTWLLTAYDSSAPRRTERSSRRLSEIWAGRSTPASSGKSAGKSARSDTASTNLSDAIASRQTSTDKNIASAPTDVQSASQSKAPKAVYDGYDRPRVTKRRDEIVDGTRNDLLHVGLPTAPEGSAIFDWARDTISRFGKKGHEYLMAVDDDGTIVEFGTANRKASTGINNKLLGAMLNPDRRLVVFHNHPRGGPLSADDIAMLAFPGMHSVWSFAPAGADMRAALTPAAQTALFSAPDHFAKMREISAAIAGARNDVSDFLAEKVRDGSVTPQQAEEAHNFASVMVALRAGLIDITSEKNYNADAIDGLNSRLDSAAAAIRESIDDGKANYTGQRISRRSTRDFRHVAEVAGLERRGERVASGRTGPEGLSEAGPSNYQGEVGEWRKLVRDFSDVKATRENIVSRLRGVITDNKSSILATVPLNYFPELAGDKLPAINDYLLMKRKMDAYRSGRHDAAAEVMDRWRKYISTGFLAVDKSKSQALADLMHDATLAGIDPALTTEEERAKPGYERLRKRFTSIAPIGQKLFADVRDAYREQADELDRLLLDNVRKAQEMAKQQAEREFEARLADIEASDLNPIDRRRRVEEAQNKHKAAMTKSTWASKARMTQLRAMFESNRVPDPYFPLARFGDYFVAVKTPRKDEAGDIVGYDVLHFSRHEKAREMEQALAELKNEFPDAIVTSGMLSKGGELKSAMDPRVVGELDKLLASANVSDDIRDALYQRWLQTMPDLSMRKRAIHRKGIAGYNTDAFRVFASTTFHAAHQMARLKYGLELQENVNLAEEQAKAIDHNQKEMALVNELFKRHQWTLNPTTKPLTNWITGAAFVYFLGATPAAALVNASQTIMVGVPVLSAKFGFARSSSELVKATREFTNAVIKETKTARGLGDFFKNAGDLRNASSLTGDERAAMEAFYESGLIDRTQSHDLAAVGETGTRYNPVREKVMNVVSYGFHKVEVFNRTITAVAAYRLAREAGQSHLEAINAAHDLTYKTHFDMSNSSRPRVTQGDIPRLATMFRSFQINMLYRLFRDIHQSLKGESRQVRREARIQLAGVTGMMALNAGLTGTVGYGLAMAAGGILKSMFGDDDDDPLDFEERFRSDILDLLGPELGGIVLKGVPGHYLGIDLTSRIGLPDLWWRSESRELNSDDALKEFVYQNLGAGFGIVRNTYNGVDLALQGNVERGVETAAPKFIRDLLRFRRYASDGVESIRGDQVIAPDDLSAWNLASQAMGFTPAKIADAYEVNTILRNAEQRIKERKRSIVNRFAKAVEDGDDEARQSALEEIEKYNAGAATRLDPITAKGLKQSLRMRVRNRQRSVGGVLIRNEALNQYLRGEVAGAEGTPGEDEDVEEGDDE